MKMDYCRICLSTDAPKYISEVRSKEKCFLEKVSFCLGIQITESTNNTNLCWKCYKKILNFHSFKCLAVKNDAYLRTLQPESLVNIKHEIYIGDDNLKTEEEDRKTNINSKINNENNKFNVVESGAFIVKQEVEVVDVDEERDFASDDELLSVIQKIKYEFISPESKENSTPKKRGRKKKDPNLKVIKLFEICDECGKEVRDLNSHKKQHRPKLERKAYKCEVCDKVFATHNSRSRHHRVKHLGLKQTCEICNKAVVNLKCHQLLKHDTSALKFECALCNRRFLSPTKLEEHITLHTKDKPYECLECGKRFRLKGVMQLHRRQVHDNEKAHLCQFCSKSFFKKYHLQIHLRSHTKEKPYKCQDCGRCFSSSSILRNHRTTHSDDRPFQCPHCDQKFARLGYMNCHIRTHTKEKRHPCKYCGILFGRSDHRRRHEHTAHEKHVLAATDGTGAVCHRQIQLSSGCQPVDHE